MLPDVESTIGQPDIPSDADSLLEAFRATRTVQEMLALAVATPDDALDALEAVVEARLGTARRVIKAVGELRNKTPAEPWQLWGTQAGRYWPTG